MLLSGEAAGEALDHAPAGIAVCDRELRWVAWNRALELLTGLASDDVIGERAVEVGAALAGDDAAALVAAVLHGICVDLDEVALEPERGTSTRWVAVRWSPQRAASGEVTGAILAAHDITARRQAGDQALRLAAIPREAPNPVLECDASGAVIYANPATRHLL